MKDIPEFGVTRKPAKTETITTQTRSIALADIHDGPVRLDTKVEEVTTPEQWWIELTGGTREYAFQDEYVLCWDSTQTEAIEAIDELINRAIITRDRIKAGDY